MYKKGQTNPEKFIPISSMGPKHALKDTDLIFQLIRPFCIMLLYRYLLHYGCYYTLCHNTYAYSFLFYKVYMNRENAVSWNSGLEKEQILETC